MKLEILGTENEEAERLQDMINKWFKKHPKINVKHIDVFPETVVRPNLKGEACKTNYYNVFIFYEELKGVS